MDYVMQFSLSFAAAIAVPALVLESAIHAIKWAADHLVGKKGLRYPTHA